MLENLYVGKNMFMWPACNRFKVAFEHSENTWKCPIHFEDWVFKKLWTALENGDVGCDIFLCFARSYFKMTFERSENTWERSY